MSDIDTVVVDSLKALDPKRPIREADMGESAAPRPRSGGIYRLPLLSPGGGDWGGGDASVLSAV